LEGHEVFGEARNRNKMKWDNSWEVGLDVPVPFLDSPKKTLLAQLIPPQFHLISTPGLPSSFLIP